MKQITVGNTPATWKYVNRFDNLYDNLSVNKKSWKINIDALTKKTVARLH